MPSSPQTIGMHESNPLQATTRFQAQEHSSQTMEARPWKPVRSQSVSAPPLCLGGCGLSATPGHDVCCSGCSSSCQSPGPRQHTPRCLRWYQECTGITFQCASPACKREAAIGFNRCCRTCKGTLSACHGPFCNEHWAETIRRDRPRIGPDPAAIQDQWQTADGDAPAEVGETEPQQSSRRPSGVANSSLAQVNVSEVEKEWTDVSLACPAPVEQASDFSTGWDEVRKHPLCHGNCGLTATPGKDYCCADCHASTMDGRRPRRHSRHCLSWFQQHTGMTFQCENIGCKREAALGYYTCCRTCAATLSREHGALCNQAWVNLTRRDPPGDCVLLPSPLSDVHS